MPLARYFIYVGGTLLLLLFVADFCLPGSPPSEKPHAEAYVIRIHSSQKWPDRVVYDTSAAMVASAGPVKLETGASPVVNAGPANAPREAFAQLRQPKTNDVRPSDKTATKSKPRHQQIASQHVARKRTPPLAHLAWRQPQFGWFDQRIW